MSERVALIVNPVATRTNPQLRDRLEAALAARGDVSVLVTERAGQAGALTARAVAEGASTVVVLGGDGTVNEAAMTLSGGDVGLVPIPAGSTNVFARALGWPHPARRAIPALERALNSPVWRDVHLARIEAGENDRIVCMNAGVGLDAETIHRVEAHPWIKTRFRHAGVSVATLRTVSASRRTAISVTIDGNEAIDLASIMVVCGSPYAYVGPRALDLAPDAHFDGRLRWFGLPAISWAALAGAFGGAVRGGRHIGHARYADGWAERSIVIESRHPVAVQADGEPLGWHTFVRITPGPTLRVLVPSSA
jgi:diacylglycerol kinase family enzyme